MPNINQYRESKLINTGLECSESRYNLVFENDSVALKPSYSAASYTENRFADVYFYIQSENFHTDAARSMNTTQQAFDGEPLCRWLHSQLERQNINVSEPVLTESGWSFMSINELGTWIVCCEGLRAGSLNQWKVSINSNDKDCFDPTGVSLRRCSNLLLAIKSVIEKEKQIGDIEWSQAILNAALNATEGLNDRERVLASA